MNSYQGLILFSYLQEFLYSLLVVGLVGIDYKDLVCSVMRKGLFSYSKSS